MQVCASRHRCMGTFLLMKLMEIEPLKALSPFRSGGQFMQTQPKTKTSQPVAPLSVIVRRTAAALPVSPHNPPRVGVDASANPSVSLYASRRRLFTMMGGK